jgi:hypothetical protein
LKFKTRERQVEREKKRTEEDKRKEEKTNEEKEGMKNRRGKERKGKRREGRWNRKPRREECKRERDLFIIPYNISIYIVPFP